MRNIGMQQFAQYLEEEGMRLTLPRRVIAHAFFVRTGHVSAEELHQSVHAKNPSIGLATVYRTLKLLQEAGLAQAHRFSDERMVYEHAAMGREHHDHLVCTSCGMIVEFTNEAIERLQELVAHKHGFVVHTHKLELYGFCPSCNVKATAPH